MLGRLMSTDADCVNTRANADTGEINELAHTKVDFFTIIKPFVSSIRKF